MSTTHDLIIIGGGPAGMTAAIYAARANIKTLLLESNITGGLVNSTHTVENFPSWPTIHGMELTKKMREHVDTCQVEVVEVCEIEKIDLHASPKVVVTDDGEFSAKAIILATGREPIALQTPTQAPNNVHHCAICDGAPYVGKHVLVVGGGNSAFDESLYLMGMGAARITIIEVMDRFFAAKATQETLFSYSQVEGRLQTKVVDLVVKNDALQEAVLENVATGAQETLAVDGIFVFLGQKPNNGLFKDSITLNQQGYITTKADMSTNIAGVYAAGDIVEKEFRQITTAVADGTIAALAAERWLRNV